MSIQAIIMDWRPAYLQSSRSAVSTLLAPLGTETVVQHLWAQLLKADIQSSAVMPDFETDTAYQSALQAVLGDVRLCRKEGFLDFLESLEPADLLLTIDPRCYALDGYDFAGLLRGSNTCHLPRHLVQLQGNARGAQERVVYDSELRVRCVQRLYDGVTQVQAVGIGASLISAAVARHLDLSAGLSPAQIRRQLAARDIPSTDVTARGPAFDLSTEAGLLALNEQVVLGSTRRARRSLGRRSEEFSLWAGPGSSIDPHSRLYGPIVVHAGARIAPHAVVIGPAVLGPGAQVARGSLVCQCVFGPGARVSAGDCIVRRVLVGQAPAKAAAGHKPSAPASAQRSEPRLLRRRRRRAASRAPTGDKRWYPRLKRAIDFSAALVGLVVLAPLLGVTALLVKLSSRGPVLFGHEREGLNGRVFRCWKFRTMIDRAHQQQRALYVKNAVDGPQFKLPNDPRVTPLGKLLRATNIDELPQLYNVLLGHMSLIGPRPSPFRENQICIPWRKARLSVRPGITGLWQVCRRERDAGDFHQWIYFDVLYVRHMSLWLDLRVLLATFLTMGGRFSVPLRLMIPGAEAQSVPEAFDTLGWLDGSAPRPVRGPEPAPHGEVSRN